MGVVWDADRVLFPARAGVILYRSPFRGLMNTVPRTRGGDPKPIGMIRDVSDCSPHARG